MAKSNGRVLVIVESPTKAKTIRKFLPKNYVVEASIGHVRDLPQSAADIPANVKKEPWSKIGVNVKENFEPLYVIPKNKTKVIADLRKKLKDADELFLATDEDREGESISWHLIEILKPKIPVKRMVFHEITKSAIEKALENTRQIDTKLVRAQETRRILDRLVGYTLSPLIWKKIAFGLSAGRVQSVGLRVIVDRERQRIQFKKSQYWDLKADLHKGGESFEAKISSIKGKKVAQGKDFDELTGKLLSNKDVVLLGEAEAKELSQALKSTSWSVTSVEEKPNTARPSPPFITSTLQQEANRKLGLSSRDAMRVAQKLYEEGYITYMRTDSPNLSAEALTGARRCIERMYGKDYLSPEPRQFSSKKGAQEAHEAIRPAGSDFTPPKDTELRGMELALYELIWKRTVASQMAEAKKLSVSVKIASGDSEFSASGTRILFPGFIRAYVEGSDDPEASLEDREVLLPDLKKGDVLKLIELNPLFHETKPVARFTEASLVQMLEKEGIGRPSTYASILSTIIDRGYVRRLGNALVPTFTGFAVTQLLERHFSELVDTGFTSEMERNLDEIAEGNLDWLPYLEKFYLGKKGLEAMVKEQEKKIDPTESRTVNLPQVKGFEIRIGRFGPYIHKEGKKKNDEAVRASLPESLAPADLNEEELDRLLEQQEKGPTPLGIDPQTKHPIYCLVGRYGPYVQLGNEDETKETKPKRVSLLKGMDPQTLTLEEALRLLQLPRILGVHPETKKPIVANLGRFGPYVVHEKDFRSLKKDDNLFEVDLKRALEIFAQPKGAGRGQTVLRELGKHPADNEVVNLMEGRYGIYVKHGKVNVSLPKDADSKVFDLESALKLLETKSTSKSSGKSVAKTKFPGTKRVIRKSPKRAKAASKEKQMSR